MNNNKEIKRMNSVENQETLVSNFRSVMMILARAINNNNNKKKYPIEFQKKLKNIEERTN